MRVVSILLCWCMSVSVFAEEVVLDLWYHVDNPEEQAFFEAQVARFNAQSAEIQIETLVLPQSAFDDFVFRKAKQGQLPDLLYFQSGSLSKFVWSGLLQSLEGLLPPNVLNNVTTATQQQGTYPVDGLIYGLSPTSKALTLYGNRRLLKAAKVNVERGQSVPWTKAEFYRVLSKLQSSGLKWPLDMQLYHADDEWYLTAFSPFFHASGGDIISRSKWDAHIALESLFMDDVSEILLPMLANEWVVPSHKATKRFERARAGLTLATSSDYSGFQASLGEDLVVLPFPVLGPHHVTSNGSWSFGVSAQTNHPSQAARFVEFVMSDEEVLSTSNRNLTVPGTLSALSLSGWFGESAPLEIPAQQYIALSRPKPLHPAYPVIRAALADALDDIMAGSDFKASLAEAADIIDGDIAENDYYPPFNEM